MTTDRERLTRIQQARSGPYSVAALSARDIDFLIEQAQEYQQFKACQNTKPSQKDDHHV